MRGFWVWSASLAILSAGFTPSVWASPRTQRARAHAKQPRLRRASARRPPIEHAPSSYFLAANPHVPLAVVREGVVRSAVSPADRGKVCGSRQRWAAEGSTWYALDGWGQRAGIATVEVVEDFDVTACGEVYFAPKFDRNTNTTVFVSTDSAYVPAASVEWKPQPSTRSTFQALLSKLAGPRRKLPYVCSEVATSTRYFDYAGGKLAVGGVDGGLLIASFDGTAWTPERSETTSPLPTCFRPVAVFDLNGDARPEIVLREVFGDGESWRDVVLARDGAGHWSRAAVSPGGATL